MSRPLITRRHSHGKVNQLDLFAGSPELGTAPTPPWQTLPVEAREAVTRLIVRLMIAHLDGDRSLDRKEVGDDL